MNSRGFAVKEIQKQQCYFPTESIVVKNLKGTANAFYLEAKNKILIVLPGPPTEIEAVWENGIAQFVKQLSIHKKLDPVVVRLWDTLGLGESEVALIIEKVKNEFFANKTITSQFDPKNFEVGYRVHLPYVEVKLIFSSSITGELSELIQTIDQALAPITPFKGTDNVYQNFVQICLEKKIQQFKIIDLVSEGYFYKQLCEKSDIKTRYYNFLIG